MAAEKDDVRSKVVYVMESIYTGSKVKLTELSKLQGIHQVLNSSKNKTKTVELFLPKGIDTVVIDKVDDDIDLKVGYGNNVSIIVFNLGKRSAIRSSHANIVVVNLKGNNKVLSTHGDLTLPKKQNDIVSTTVKNGMVIYDDAKIESYQKKYFSHLVQEIGQEQEDSLKAEQPEKSPAKTKAEIEQAARDNAKKMRDRKKAAGELEGDKASYLGGNARVYSGANFNTGSIKGESKERLAGMKALVESLYQQRNKKDKPNKP